MIIIRQKEFGKIGNKIRDYLIKKSREHDVYNEELTNKIIKDNAKECGVKKIVVLKDDKGGTAYRDGGIITLNNKDTNNASTIAHEIGHAYHYNNSNSKVGAAFHKLDNKINDKYIDIAAHTFSPEEQTLPKKEILNKLITKQMKAKKIVGSVASGGSGLIAGYLAEREKERGHKGKARLITASSLLIPALGHASELGREASASIKGLNMMKKAGASKDQIKSARKSLGYALGTYGIGLGKNLAINVGGQLTGKGLYKVIQKKKRKQKEEEHKNDSSETKRIHSRQII